jgi:hypothetical protein
MAVHHVLDDYFLAITLLVTIAYQLIGFSIAFTCKFDKLTGKSKYTPGQSLLVRERRWSLGATRHAHKNK